LSDLPNMASRRHQESCGFSLYQGVLVQWDEDRDTRVLTFIDQLSDEARSSLLVVQEHEGCLGLVWKDAVPDGYDPNEFYVEDGVCDQWSVTNVIVIQSIKPEGVTS